MRVERAVKHLTTVGLGVCILGLVYLLFSGGGNGLSKEARNTAINDFDDYMGENLYEEDYEPIVLVTIKNEEEETGDSGKKETLEELAKVQNRLQIFD